MFSASDRPLEEQGDVAAAGLEPLGQPGAAAGEEDNDDGEGAEEPPAKRQSINSSRQELQRRRSQCVGHLQFAARILAKTRTWC